MDARPEALTTAIGRSIPRIDGRPKVTGQARFAADYDVRGLLHARPVLTVAHLVHLRVDRESGEVRVLDHVVAQDVGRALNPAIIEGQLHGGATQGLGWALSEAMVFDDTGQLLTGTFLDYALPKADASPWFETLLVEVPSTDGPYGARGIGEGPVCGAAAAVANAVHAATGVRYRSLPMTAPRIWRGLQDARPVDAADQSEMAVVPAPPARMTPSARASFE